MRILFIHNKYRYQGGEERSVALQTEVLAREGHDVTTYTRDSRDIEALTPLEKLRAGAAVAYSRKVYREVSVMIAERKPQIVHVHNVFPLVTPSSIRAAADAGVPVVYSHHNYRLSCPKGLRYLRGEVCDRCTGGFFLPAVANRCVQDRFWPSLGYAVALQLHNFLGTFSRDVTIHISPTRGLGRHLARILPKGTPIEVVHHFLPDHAAVAMTSARPYILYLGRISEEKGVQVLLQAVKGLLHRVDLEILGDGPLRQQLTEGARTAGDEGIRFRGHLAGDGRFAFLAGALAVVVPSLCDEVAPYVVLESFRAGVPVIAARAGGLEESVEEGVNGLLFPRGSWEGLSGAIRQLLEDGGLRERLCQGARDTYQQKYTVDRGYGALMGCYQRVLADERRHVTAN